MINETNLLLGKLPYGLLKFKINAKCLKIYSLYYILYNI